MTQKTDDLRLSAAASELATRTSHGSSVARGVSQLSFDAVEQLSRIVEAMHANIAARPLPLGRGTSGRTRGVTRFVYESIRVVNAGARAATERLLGLMAPTGAAPPAQSGASEWQAVLNGVVGDHLAASENPLAIPMQLRPRGEARGRLLVLIHGLCLSDAHWARNDHDHGEALARDLGIAPVYLLYNTGRHVSENGRELAQLLEELLEDWPVPIESLAILAHSMGGLVARSACHEARERRLGWLARLDQIVFLGTPHHGAPLERGGSWLDQLLGVSPYSSPLVCLGMLRSAGITDLRHGNVRDEDWQGRERFGPTGDRRIPTPLPDGVACHALAGARDALVPIASALGRSRSPEWTLAFPEPSCWVGDDIGHLDLLDHTEVYAEIRRIFAAKAGRSCWGARLPHAHGPGTK